MTKLVEEKDMAGSREGAWAAAGFAAVLVLVGLPVWWYTTTVYRAHLPYSTIVNLSGQPLYHATGMTLVGETTATLSVELEKNLRSMQGIKFQISKRKPRKEEIAMIKSAVSLSDLDNKLTQIMHVAAGTLAVFVVHEPDFFESNVSIIVGRHRLTYVKPGVDVQLLSTVIKSMVIDPLANKRAQGSKLLHQLPGMHKREAMRQVPTEPGYDVTLTLMVPEPHRTEIDWDAKAAVNGNYLCCSFLVPRWGGVMIHNIPLAKGNASFPHYVTLDSHWIMSTVLTHLHRLLPIPSLKETEGLKILPSLDTCLLTEWQLDGLARARVSYYLSNIHITLQSLCELVGEISNMVISDEVGGWVWGAVEEWSECGQAAREGRLQEATLYCSRSFTQADAAFFHPSMLALLYFPDNQKYAIYVPLFLPVSIPVILSLKMVLGLYWKPSPRKEKVE
nr:GPI transamidase component PIG-S-like [Cherax quadricarinatus]